MQALIALVQYIHTYSIRPTQKEKKNCKGEINRIAMNFVSLRFMFRILLEKRKVKDYFSFLTMEENENENATLSSNESAQESPFSLSSMLILQV